MSLKKIDYMKQYQCQKQKHQCYLLSIDKKKDKILDHNNTESNKGVFNWRIILKYLYYLRRG